MLRKLTDVKAKTAKIKADGKVNKSLNGGGFVLQRSAMVKYWRGNLMQFICFFILLFVSAERAVACSCAFHDGPLEEAVLDSYKNASAVVLATAKNVENLKPSVGGLWSEEKGFYIGTKYSLQRTQFVTLKSWKGAHEKIFYTKITIICCQCGYSFEEGVSYLLYLYGPSKDGHYTTSSCSRTKKETVKVEKELSILDKIVLTKELKKDVR